MPPWSHSGSASFSVTDAAHKDCSFHIPAQVKNDFTLAPVEFVIKKPDHATGLDSAVISPL
ncbi:hypothetical protein [Desulfobacter curvatus]|uniref:hypothetical protein n=1 Tax=Desulfobacter curvatus TaxID=2290 RepID=UPI00037A0C42|nr:hypothetical protein [Desulfobacter curvatus]